MWSCPKCGRSFKKENQQHACGKQQKMIDESISGQSGEQQAYVRKVRGNVS